MEVDFVSNHPSNDEKAPEYERAIALRSLLLLLSSFEEGGGGGGKSIELNAGGGGGGKSSDVKLAMLY
jgi:hypothetical protein